MIISGLQKTTLLDYPGHVAATVFLGGCNFRCPFCHNMDIVILENDKSNVSSVSKVYSEEDILNFLKKRKEVLDGVCITGGEPTLNNELSSFLYQIKSIKKNNGDALLIKLDTNGTNPKMLSNLISENLIDYVAMDIKSSVDNYNELIGIESKEKCDEIIEKIKKSIIILKNSNIEYEFRTTVIKNFHDEKTMHGIGELINGADKYFIQSFKDSEFVLDHTLEAFEKEILNRYVDIMSEYAAFVSIRGVD